MRPRVGRPQPITPENWLGRDRPRVYDLRDSKGRGGRMEIRILGPLELVDNGKLLALRGAKQRTVVGLLALNAPRPVSSDRIVDELWGEHPQQSALHAIQVYISEIRMALRAGTGTD